jgi:hypothetical protein
MNQFAKPKFNSAEENYQMYYEGTREMLRNRNLSNGALPSMAWRKLIRDQIKYLRKLRVKCDPGWLENFHYCIRG